jgi:hypothetical protein
MTSRFDNTGFARTLPTYVRPRRLIEGPVYCLDSRIPPTARYVNYSAAVACGALNLADGVRLVKQRAEMMVKLYPRGYGLAAGTIGEAEKLTLKELLRAGPTEHGFHESRRKFTFERVPGDVQASELVILRRLWNATGAALLWGVSAAFRQYASRTPRPAFVKSLDR